MSAENFLELYASWIGEGLRPVSQDMAQERARMCLNCPKHDVSRPIYEALAKGIALTVRQQIELKNQMKLRVEGEKSLHLCGACDCVLRLKIWAPLEFVKETTALEKLDVNCWIRKELGL